MPTYQYVCTECGGQLEAVQKFTDDPLTVHDDCGGRLRKVYSPVGIVFKGSGFYRTDSRGNSSSSSSSTVAPVGSPSDSSSSSSSDSESKPAQDTKDSAKPAASTSSSSGGSSGEKVA
jgi:putative FmdB family regulatory protein